MASFAVDDDNPVQSFPFAPRARVIIRTSFNKAREAPGGNRLMILQMGPMWVLAGLSGGWLAENLLRRGGYGLIVDMVLGLGGSIAGGWIVLALAPPSLGMLAMFAVGLIAASSVIVVQRLCWRSLLDEAETRTILV